MRRVHFFCGALAAACAGLMSAASGCTTTPINSSLRSLEESGRVSLVCMSSPWRDPAADPAPVLPLARCRGAVNADFADEYGIVAGAAGATTGAGGSGAAGGSSGAAGEGGAVQSANNNPHLYALVTQTVRGEVAVVDLSTIGGDAVIDQDPAVPGPNFLPIGGQPAGIVSSPGSTASFVTVAEVGREGIFAIPSTQIVRPCPSDVDLTVDALNKLSAEEQHLVLERAKRCAGKRGGAQPAPELSSWPSCSLPAAPGEPVLVNDPADADGNERAACNSPDYVKPATGSPNGDLTTEGHGRQKLAVPLPSLGGVAILDAQKLLDQPAGDFAPCDIERWVLLDSDVPPISVPPPPKTNACANPVAEMPNGVTGAPQPAGLALSEGVLYLADLRLPLIHRLSLSSPCEPVLAPPLLPFAAEDPTRIVTTERIAITPQPTASLKRYLYATDSGEGTVMVFDVSDGATQRTPLYREHPEWTPLQPRDRIRFVSAPRDLIAVQHDVAKETKDTGVAPEGTVCDPDPNLKACTNATDLTCVPDIHTLYRTSSDYTAGAGPYTLRGTFGFVLLTNGQIQIIDIEDLDAACRIPPVVDPLLGCDVPECSQSSPVCPSNYAKCAPGKDPVLCTQSKDFEGSREDSCNVVQPNTLRSQVFIVDDDRVGDNAPALSSFPLLFDPTGGLIDATNPQAPSLRSTVPSDGRPPIPVIVQGLQVSLDQYGTPLESDAQETAEGNAAIVSLNLETPRAQSVNQGFTITFEGALPRFGAVASELRVSSPDPMIPDGVYDSTGRYCDGGVQSKRAVKAAGHTDAEAKDLADRLQISTPLADETDIYWVTAARSANGFPDDKGKPTDVSGLASCTFDPTKIVNANGEETKPLGSHDVYTICHDVFGDGTETNLFTTRDFIIEEAFQDRLLLDDTTLNVTAYGAKQTCPGLRLAKFCFPAYVSYLVRPGDQWVVTGDATGFMHHMVADAENGGFCRESCDPVKARMNGRAQRTPRALGATGIKDGSPTAFINQMLRFALVDGKDTACDSSAHPGLDCDRPARDMQFRFATIGSFSPFLITLLKNTRDIAPVGISLISPTGELAITDGALEGLITVSLASVDTNRQFY